MKKAVKVSTVARLEKNGQIAFTDGERIKKVPSEAACKERLIQLLEMAHGNKQHKLCADFWKERAKAIACADEMEVLWARETFERLSKIWDELTTPPMVEPEPDAFGSFGI